MRRRCHNGLVGFHPSTTQIPMAVVPLTVTISLCLALTFVVFFIREQLRARLGSLERESLLPLAEEKPRMDGSET